MYQRPAGLSHLIAAQMRPEEWGLRRDRLGGCRRKEAVPAPFFTISVAFLKGYIRGHVTFRGLNKKKKRIYSVAKCAFLFILLVWAFKAVLVAVEPAPRIPVSHLPLCTKCTLVPFKQPMVALLWSVQLLQLTLKAQRGTLEGTSCFKVCTLLPTTFAVRFYFVLQTRRLCLLPDRATVLSLFSFYFLIFEGLRLATRRTEILQLLFPFKSQFSYFF